MFTSSSLSHVMHLTRLTLGRGSRGTNSATSGNTVDGVGERVGGHCMCRIVHRSSRCCLPSANQNAAPPPLPGPCACRGTGWSVRPRPPCAAFAGNCGDARLTFSFPLAFSFYMGYRKDAWSFHCSPSHRRYPVIAVTPPLTRDPDGCHHATGAPCSAATLVLRQPSALALQARWEALGVGLFTARP